MDAVYVIRFTDTGRYLCYRNGQWDGTGFAGNAAMFTSKRLAENVVATNDMKYSDCVVERVVYTYPNLFSAIT